MSAIPAVFYFSFSFDAGTDKERQQHLGFIVSPEGAAKLPQDDPPDMEFFELEEAEDYGVHDWGSSPDPRVIATGYHSYEVAETDVQKLMALWRKAFVRVCGKKHVSAVVEFTLGDRMTDFDIHEAIRQNLEMKEPAQ